MTAPELQACLDALPPDIRQELDDIRDIGRGPFRHAQTQQIVDDHLVLLIRLRRQYHATHADLVAVLGHCGITGPGGAALTAATLSSAISRARAKSKVSASKVGAPKVGAPKIGASKSRARTASPARAAAPSPVSERPRGHAEVGEPEPDLVFASQAAPPPRTVAPTDADLVVGAQVSSSGHEAPEVRRSDHRGRQIDFLARAMED
ncbi:hypothetical protein [Bradyrhizobium sp. CCBAU 11357]|uniref:hypothetical protein n=1 Tax=Bradyrhizobium sp. CCBAU 11357 TaxID=1630808 RepID=UPI002304D009|nr:hypothetical protein [Bradyrhizobium sp. CCBAU 11357]MDA9497439.1 hypothetical protein [Bradyrhizobium sp. CCBAU 11357]